MNSVETFLLAVFCLEMAVFIWLFRKWKNIGGQFDDIFVEKLQLRFLIEVIIICIVLPTVCELLSPGPSPVTTIALVTVKALGSFSFNVYIKFYGKER